MALAQAVQDVVEAVQNTDPVEQVATGPDPLWSGLDMGRNLGLGALLQSLNEIPNRKRLIIWEYGYGVKTR